MSLKAPDHPIVAFDSDYVLPQQIHYNVNEDLVISDEFQNIIYTSQCELNKITVRNGKEGNVVFNVKFNEMIRPIEKFTIYLGSTDTTEIATVKLKPSFLSKKYIIDFVNKTSNNREELILKCNTAFSTCEIYSGNKKFGAPLICKMRQIFVIKFDFDIAPNVDRLFMLAIAEVFFKLNKINTQVGSW